MSNLGRLNYYVLRWFWIRLYKKIEAPDGKALSWGIAFPVRPSAWWEDS